MEYRVRKFNMNLARALKKILKKMWERIYEKKNG